MKLQHWINNNQLSALRKRVYLFLKRDQYMNTYDGYNFEIHGKFFSNSKFYIFRLQTGTAFATTWDMISSSPLLTEI